MSLCSFELASPLYLKLAKCNFSPKFILKMHIDDDVKGILSELDELSKIYNYKLPLSYDKTKTFVSFYINYGHLKKNKDSKINFVQKQANQYLNNLIYSPDTHLTTYYIETKKYNHKNDDGTFRTGLFFKLNEYQCIINTCEEPQN